MRHDLHRRRALVHRSFAHSSNQSWNPITVPKPTAEFHSAQKIPIESLGARVTEELELDNVAKVVLQTHRAYHHAWKRCCEVCNIRDEERPPPPSYDDISGIPPGSNGVVQQIEDSSSPSALESCYCWICGRVKNEKENSSSFLNLSIPTRIQSPEELDEKRSLNSSSASDDEQPAPFPDLTKKQIKMIKVEITLYRRIEEIRLKKLLQTSE